MDLIFTSQFPLRSVENKAACGATKKRAKEAAERDDLEQIEPTIWLDRTLDDQTFAVLADVYLVFEWLDGVAETAEERDLVACPSTADQPKAKRRRPTKTTPKTAAEERELDEICGLIAELHDVHGLPLAAPKGVEHLVAELKNDDQSGVAVVFGRSNGRVAFCPHRPDVANDENKEESGRKKTVDGSFAASTHSPMFKLPPGRRPKLGNKSNAR